MPFEYPGIPGQTDRVEPPLGGIRPVIDVATFRGTVPGVARIGILTSGGDCPGLNALVCSAATLIEEAGSRPVLLRDGYQALLGAAGGGAVEIPLELLDRRRLPRIGGTFLGSSRTNPKKEVLATALRGVRALKLDALLVVGGDGSLRSAHRLSAALPVAAVPKTIDNDVSGTELALGFQTAVQTAATAIERIQDTARSHDSAFLVEVMGRRSGFLAAAAAEATGADAVTLPEQRWVIADLRDRLHPGGLLVMAEGGWPADLVIPPERTEQHLAGVAHAVLVAVQGTGLRLRTTSLGHTLRGGPPVAADRILASSFASLAVGTLLEGRSSLCAVRRGRAVALELDEAALGRRFLSEADLRNVTVPVIGR